MKKDSLLGSPAYRSFIADRDRALEVLHNHAQQDISRMLYDALEYAEGLVARFVLRRDGHNDQQIVRWLDSGLSEVFSGLGTQIYQRMIRLRRGSYLLAYAAEMEAIGRATGRLPSLPAHSNPEMIRKIITAPTLTQEKLDARIQFGLFKLKNKILQKLYLGLIQNLTDREIVEKVAEAYPEYKIYKRPPRELKPLKEADQNPKPKEEFVFDLLDEGDWDLILSAYKDAELPPSRFDRQEHYDPEKGTMRYAWEVEQEMTDDFVNQVRQGQVAAAKELGIKEFVWVAVLDDRIDECCIQRHGKTTSEIEAGLNSGEIDSDLCDATSPPAHPNCRCSLAPVANVEPVEGPDWKSFGEWLNS